ncbi:MAG: ABC transporter substrate-binding protein [Bacteroidales bacterium]|nr:ABC transporter substrate-binding protein [Bacteroidales bacterium]
MEAFFQEWKSSFILAYRSIILSSVVLVISTFSLQGQDYHRIITLSSSLTNFICLLESTDELIGCTTYCEIPETLEVTKVATAITVSVEKVFTLKPDLVLATILTKPETIQKLRQLGIRVELFNTPVSFDEICEQLLRVGTFTGKDDLARQIIVREKQKIRKLQALIPSNPEKPSLFFQIGANPLFSVLSGTFMDDYITMAGATNIAADYRKGSVNRESILLRNPDIIIIASMGILGEQEIETWKKYPGLSAADNNMILLVDANKACSPTPVQFVEILQEIIEFIY